MDSGMSSMMVELATQAPQMVILVLLVYMMIRSQEKISARHEESHVEALIKYIESRREALATHKEIMAQVVDQNRETAREFLASISEMRELIREQSHESHRVIEQHTLVIGDLTAVIKRRFEA